MTTRMDARRIDDTANLSGCALEGRGSETIVRGAFDRLGTAARDQKASVNASGRATRADDCECACECFCECDCECDCF